MKGSVTPVSYALEFEPDLGNATFRGTESVSVRCDGPTDTITMHCAELDIVSCRVEAGGGAGAGRRSRGGRGRGGGKAMPVGCTAATDGPAELLRIRLDAKISGDAVVHIEFEGTLNDRLLGFYRSRYTHEGRTKYLATTQFEAADARRAFPCWDEPEAKATFDISIITDPGLSAISNMPALSRRKRRGDGKTVHVFARTPVVSTYLVYLGVGEFEYLTSRGGGRTRVRVVTTKGNRSKGRFALDLGRRLLSMYERYFGIRYPLPKLDLIAVPDFAAGAMENWGAITFRETILLYDPRTSSTRTKQFIAEVISHEIAHQWFGNLVTMRWWNDLWLNESFATFMATKFVDMLYPEWDMWNQFVEGAMNTAMGLDSLKTTHPIDVRVESPSEIREIFDAISYDKGGCILRMLEDYVGEPAFRRGLRRYLSEFKYGNATGQDLWEAIGRASGMPVAPVVNRWLRQPGFPLVSVSQKGRSVRLRQERYLREPYPDGGDDDSNGGGAGGAGGGPQKRQLWPIPLSVGLGRDETLHRGLFSRRTTSLKLPAGTVGFVANHGRKGFYRVRYDEAILLDLKMLVDSRRMPAIDRWAVQNDLFSLCVSGRAGVRNYLDFSDAYLDEPSYLASSNVAGNLYALYLHSYGEGFAGEIGAHAAGYLRGILSRLGWDPRRSDRHTDALLRSLAVSCLGRLNDGDATAEALERYDRFLESPGTLQPDLVEPVCSIAAWNGGQQVHADLARLYGQAATMEEKLRFLGAMCGFRNKRLITRSLDFSLTPDVRSQNLQLPVMKAAANPYCAKRRDLLWPWLRRNWKRIGSKAGRGNPLLNRIVASIAPVADDSMEQEIRGFFERNPTPGTERTQAQTLERIRINSRFHRMMRAEFGEAA